MRAAFAGSVKPPETLQRRAPGPTGLASPGFLSDFGRRWLFMTEMTNGQQLLADYVGNRSELAFRELVGRYIDLVYSTAIRRVGGDAHLAEDIAQIVFADLARMARTLPEDCLDVERAIVR